MREEKPVEWWKEGAVEGAPESIPISPPGSHAIDPMAHNPFHEFQFVPRPEHAMSFTDSIESVIRNFVNFSDRASRSEYWWFQLFFVVALATADFIDVMMSELAEVPFSWFGTIAFFGLIIPNLAVTVRRLHDLGYSGWFILLVFIPCVGSIIGLVILVFMVVEGQSQINDYGTVPTNTIVRE
tara:strand:- start:11818 stop:12366 length:549 start_codon:yes stop_codon:yes gene_type:complete